jgi:hypothetical protein
MKSKSLRAISLFLFLLLGGSFASSTTVYFWNAANNAPYCNYLVYSSFNSPDLWQGQDMLVPACVAGSDSTIFPAGGPLAVNNATLVGFSAVAIGNRCAPCGIGPVVGPGIFFADNIYNAFTGSYTGVQWGVFTVTPPPVLAQGWIGIASVNEVIMGDNFGHLHP